MNLKKIKETAQNEMPKVDVHVQEGTYRHNVIDSLKGSENIGIELGVASGIFSSRMLNSGKFKQFFGVDVYSDTHDTQEYKLALRNIGILNNYKLLRMTFNDALDLFEDEFFDFIYVDGFAHTGEEGGETLNNWYRKLKIGGIMAGDDYDPKWPLVQWAVNDFVNQLNVPLKITEHVEEPPFSACPSWFFVKEETHKNLIIKTHDTLLSLGKMEKDRINQARMKRMKKKLTFKYKVKQKIIRVFKSFSL